MITFILRDYLHLQIFHIARINHVLRRYVSCGEYRK